MIFYSQFQFAEISVPLLLPKLHKILFEAFLGVNALAKYIFQDCQLKSSQRTLQHLQHSPLLRQTHAHVVAPDICVLKRKKVHSLTNGYAFREKFGVQYLARGCSDNLEDGSGIEPTDFLFLLDKDIAFYSNILLPKSISGVWNLTSTTSDG